LAALLHQHTGSWIPVFATAIALDISTAVLALLVLRPMRRRIMEHPADEPMSANGIVIGQ
jgi:hypothetical protein